MSSFKKNTTESHTKLREFNVGEPEESNMPDTQYAPGYELSPSEREELQRYRQDMKQMPRIGEHAKTRIEILANIGRSTREAEIDGITFGLRTLKSREAREATMSIFGCANDVDASFEIRRQTLARAIYEIDGQSMEFAVGSNNLDSKLQVIDGMEDVMIVKLYNEFNMLRNEVQTKYGLQTEKEVKAVAEDIKK